MVVAAAGARPPRIAGDLHRFARAILPTATAAAVQLLTFVLTGRALGPEAFGALAATYAVAAVATDVAGLGGDAAMIRTLAVAPERRAEAWGHALALLLASFVPVAAAATAVAALVARPVLDPETVALLVTGEIAVGRATAAGELIRVALGRPAAAGLVRLGAALARAGAALLAFGLLGTSSAQGWAEIAAVQSLLTAALVLGACGLVRPRIEPAALGFGLLLMLNGLSRSLAANLDRILLAALLPPAAMGVYAAGSRLQLVGAIANQAASRILHPRFFRAAAAGPEALGALTREAAARMAAAGVAASLAIALLAPLLPLLLGADFAGAGRVAAGMGLACPFVALQYPPGDAMTASGRQGLRTRVTLAGVLAAAALLAAGASVGGTGGAVSGFVAGQAAIAGLLWRALTRSRR